MVCSVAMLKVENLHAFYGKSHVLHGVDCALHPGEIVALLGRNGSGRSTAAKAIMGMLDWHGHISWRSCSLAGKAPHEIAHLGLGYVPEGRCIFPDLTVHQNLLLGQKKQPKHSGHTGAWNFDRVYTQFPLLHARQHVAAGVLSGGEQQLLSLCRTLMGNPDCLVIDEPTEGLAPQMIAHVAQSLQQLRQQGIAILLIEQKLTIALDISTRVLVMGRGRIVFDGPPEALRAHTDVCQEWLQV